MITEEETRRIILERVEVLPSCAAALLDALGRFSAGEMQARLSLPGFDNSAMDGYAVRSMDCKKGARLRVAGEQPAGLDRRLRVERGEAVRIFTGAPLPQEADAVVMQEDVSAEGASIVLNTNVEPGEFVRRKGSDLSDGQKILAIGDRLRPETLALLASQGLAEIEVGGIVRAAIVSTGDELAAPNDALKPGQIYESNSTLLSGLLQKCGAAVASTVHVPDEPAKLEEALRAGLKQNALIINGGVSVGDRDFVRPALRNLGAEIDLWRVAIKPGKPFLFGRCGGCAVFGLPGNPVSAFVTFLLLVRPALLKMMGARGGELHLPVLRASLACDLENASERTHYIRGNLNDGIFTPIGRQESHALYSLAQCNALLGIGPRENFAAGAMVSVRSWL